MANKAKLFGADAQISMLSSATVLLGALFANQVNAQELTQPTANPQGNAETEVETEISNSPAVVEEVVIYGIKQSLSNAQDIKRNAATVVDAVTASDITSLPDKSVVDALTRVPGVTVEVFEATDDPEHFGAEGSTALVRGLSKTLTQFNGRTSFSATQWGALNLSHIPSELVYAIEVQKNQTASMIEGGIAGTLNLVTRKAFDSPGMMYGGSIKADYTDEAEAWSPNVSGLFSNRWETDLGEFGFLVSLAASETKTRSEAVGTHDYYEKSNRTEPDSIRGDSLEGVGTPIPGAAEDATYWLPPSIQARAKNDERDRIGFVSSLQWQNLDETVKATMEFIRSDGTSTWTERLVQNKDQLGDQLGNRNIVNVAEIPGVSGLEESFNPNTGLFTHGVLVPSGTEDYGYAPETRFHNEETYVNDLSFDIEWFVNDNLTLSGDLQYVDSGQDMFDNTIHSFFRSDVWLDLRDNDTPQIGFLGENFRQLTPAQAAAAEGSLMVDANGNYWGGDLSSISDPANVHTRSAMVHQTDSKGDAIAFSVDADYAFDDGWLTNVKAGVRHSSRKQVHKSSEYDWGVISPEWSEDDIRSVADYPEFQEFVNFGGDFHDGNAFVDGSATAF
ncbi:MAG TPA: TonB-dependent receptor plug domain-containing protein, partial [Cellvibrionaceae bacterium]